MPIPLRFIRLAVPVFQHRGGFFLVVKTKKRPASLEKGRAVFHAPSCKNLCVVGINPRLIVSA